MSWKAKRVIDYSVVVCILIVLWYFDKVFSIIPWNWILLKFSPLNLQTSQLQYSITITFGIKPKIRLLLPINMQSLVEKTYLIYYIYYTLVVLFRWRCITILFQHKIGFGFSNLRYVYCSNHRTIKKQTCFIKLNETKSFYYPCFA